MAGGGPRGHDVPCPLPTRELLPISYAFEFPDLFPFHEPHGFFLRVFLQMPIEPPRIPSTIRVPGVWYERTASRLGGFRRPLASGGMDGRSAFGVGEYLAKLYVHDRIVLELVARPFHPERKTVVNAIVHVLGGKLVPILGLGPILAVVGVAEGLKKASGCRGNLSPPTWRPWHRSAVACLPNSPPTFCRATSAFSRNGSSSSP